MLALASLSVCFMWLLQKIEPLGSYSLDLLLFTWLFMSKLTELCSSRGPYENSKALVI